MIAIKLNSNLVLELILITNNTFDGIVIKINAKEINTNRLFVNDSTFNEAFIIHIGEILKFENLMIKTNSFKKG
jgi:hypothetical protein